MYDFMFYNGGSLQLDPLVTTCRLRILRRIVTIKFDDTNKLHYNIKTIAHEHVSKL